MFDHKRGVIADLTNEEVGVPHQIDAPGEHSINNGTTPRDNSLDLQEVTLGTRRKATENLLDAIELYDKRRKVATCYEVGDLVLWKGLGTCMGDKGVNNG